MRARTGVIAFARVATLAAFVSLSAQAKAQEAPTGRAVTVVHRAPGNAPSLGPRYAPVTIEYFGSLDYGRRSTTELARLERLYLDHPNRVRVVFYLVKKSKLNQAAYEAFRQGRFWQFARAVRESGWPKNERIPDYCRAAGVDVARVERVLAQPAPANELIEAAETLRQRRQLATGSRSNIVFNGVEHRPANPAEWESAYQSAYARARAALDRGTPVRSLFRRLLRDVELERNQTWFSPGDIDERADADPPPTTAGPGWLLGDVDRTGPLTLGPARAPVVVVFFCNAASSHCRTTFRHLSQLRDNYPESVRVVYKGVFTDDQRGAELAQRAIYCAAEQDAEWQFADQLFKRYPVPKLERERLVERAAGVDLDPEELDNCLVAERHADQVAREMQRARDAGVVFTPSIAVGRRLYVGKRTWTDLQRMVELELRPGLLERAGELRHRALQTVAPAPELDPQATDKTP